MDKSLDLLKVHQVGIWCKRAAWIILALTLVRILLVCSVLFGVEAHFLVRVWSSLLQTLVPLASRSLFDFFLLYAVGVVMAHLTSSKKKKGERNN